MTASKYVYSMTPSEDGQRILPYWRLVNPQDAKARLLYFWESPGVGFTVGVRTPEGDHDAVEFELLYEECDEAGAIVVLKSFDVPPPERGFLVNQFRQRRRAWERLN